MNIKQIVFSLSLLGCSINVAAMQNRYKSTSTKVMATAITAVTAPLTYYSKGLTAFYGLAALRALDGTFRLESRLPQDSAVIRTTFWHLEKVADKNRMIKTPTALLASASWGTASFICNKLWDEAAWTKRMCSYAEKYTRSS